MGAEQGQPPNTSQPRAGRPTRGCRDEDELVALWKRKPEPWNVAGEPTLQRRLRAIVRPRFFATVRRFMADADDLARVRVAAARRPPLRFEVAEPIREAALLRPADFRRLVAVAIVSTLSAHA
jgi:hypothetical protein